MSLAPRLSGASLIIAATAVGGGAGYIVTVLAGARLGEDYAGFAVFWSALYLVVGALAGIQHEVSRAAHPRASSDLSAPRPVARNFALGAAVVVAVVTASTSPLWITLLSESGGWMLVLPLTVGVAGYVVVAVIGGVFYGLAIWRMIAFMIMLDGVLRLAAVGILLVFTSDMQLLAWAIVLPFVVAPIVVWLLARNRVVGAFTLDVGYSRLTWNVARTVTASAASGILISGLPLFVSLSAVGTAAGILSSVLFTITAARAPVIIAVMSLQSFLVVRFRQDPANVVRNVLKIAAMVLAGTLVVSLLAYVLSPWVFSELLPRLTPLPSQLVAIIVASGGLVGVLCVTAAAALSRSLHFVTTSGWVLAAAATLLLLFLPLPLDASLSLALLIGPVIGLAVHIIGLSSSRSPLVSPSVDDE